MNPIVFGSRERQLFGIHTPAQGRRRRRGAVICAPLGQEYERAHRACRLLGERMAANGYDVLRFDYYGTGDSGGTREDVTLRSCARDTVTAVEEICALANVRHVTLVGLRLGAAIADRAAGESPTADRLAYWDPVSDGRDYLHELLYTAGRAVSASRTGTPYVLGYPLTPPLEQELNELEPRSFSAGRVREVLLITSEERATHSSLLRHLQARHGTAALTMMPGPRSWMEQADNGDGAVNVAIVDHIASWGN